MDCLFLATEHEAELHHAEEPEIRIRTSPLALLSFRRLGQ